MNLTDKQWAILEPVFVRYQGESLKAE